MQQFWICVGHIWAVPPVKGCYAEGEGDSGAEKHTKATGHPTVTTLMPDLITALRQER